MKLKGLILTSLLLSLGIVLPLAFGQLPQIGKILLPMHIPVFLCSFTCGSKYATPMAFLMPLIRFSIFTLPLFPLSVATELAAYGFFTDFIYKRIKRKGLSGIYISLIFSMLLGRLVRIITQCIFLFIFDNRAAIPVFLSGTVVLGLIGAALQLIILPPIILIVKKCGLESKNPVSK